MWCMKRTNIYLGDAQKVMLDRMANAQGISRAELIRQFIDREVSGPRATDLEADLAAITDSFGLLQGEDSLVTRAPDERAKHLERTARRSGGGPRTC